MYPKPEHIIKDSVDIRYGYLTHPYGVGFRDVSCHGQQVLKVNRKRDSSAKAGLFSPK